MAAKTKKTSGKSAKQGAKSRGSAQSVRRLKDDVKEVKEGFECGIKLKNVTDLAEGDQLEFFEIKEVARTL